jgi:hypothetical protein
MPSAELRAMIAPADRVLRTARCTNVATCPRAASGEALPWYSGAGEYCPDCGEALVAGDAQSTVHPVVAMPAAAQPPAATLPAAAARSVRGDVRTPLTAVDRLRVPPTARDTGFVCNYAGVESSRRRSLRIVPSSPYSTGTC